MSIEGWYGCELIKARIRVFQIDKSYRKEKDKTDENTELANYSQIITQGFTSFIRDNGAVIIVEGRLPRKKGGWG